MACRGLVLSGFALRCTALYWHDVVLAGGNRLGELAYCWLIGVVVCAMIFFVPKF